MNIKLRISSIVLCFVLIFNLISSSFIYIYAEDGSGSAQETQADFLNFYANNVSSLDINSLTTQDYYVLSVFMSNYYQPGVTTLKDVLEGTGFFDEFSNAMGRSGNADLKSIVMAIGEDTRAGLESGECTLVNKNGAALTGERFLKALYDSVPIDFYGENDDLGEKNEINYNGGKLESSKIYYKDNSESNIAFDFSAPATRAAFQTLAAYNNELFLNAAGIECLDRMFIDAVGNVWGVDAKDKTDELEDSLNLIGLVSFVGPENVYLILPACLNPSVFSPKVTNPEDLRMPLMNRFTLGCIAKMGYFKGSNNEPIFNTKDIPFYNLLAPDNISSMANIAKSLTIFGVQSISPYLMNTGGNGDNGFWNYAVSWSNTEKQQDLANFIYDSQLITLNTSVTNGIGKYGTNSYLVFSPNAHNLLSGDTTNKIIDMNEGIPFFETDEFNILSSEEDDKRRLLKQQKLLLYLFTPTILSLNQVSMSVYYQDGLSSSSNVIQDLAENLYKYEDANDIVASKMGMRGLDLFFDLESELIDLDDGDYKGIRADNIVHSRLVESISKDFDNRNPTIYSEVKGGNMSNVSSVVLSEILNSNDFTSDAWNFDSWVVDYEKGNDGIDAWHIYLKPEGFANMGSWDDDVGDITISRTLSLSDYGIANRVGHLKDGLTNDEKVEGLNLYAKAGMTVHILTALYGYSIFTPGEEMIRAMTVPDNITQPNALLFGSDVSFNPSISLSTFSNQDFVMGVYFGYILDMMGISVCEGSTEGSEGSLEFYGFNSVFLPKYIISAKGGEMSFLGDTFGSGVLNSEDLSFEEKQKDLINRIYGLTNDSNNDYRNNLIKNILEGFILTIHRTITGTWSSNVDTITTGSSSTYQSVTGYIYTPTLEELSFTATLMNNYIKIYIFCLMIVIFLMVLMVVLHMRSWQQGLFISMVMAVALLFPYILISNTVNISNKVSDSIYSDRFDFWALTQQQQSVRALNSTAGMNEKDTLLTLSSATADLTYTGSSGVKIKWMSPKKVEMFENLYNDKSLSDSFITNMEIFKWLFNSFIYDSEFVDTDVYGSYLYRPYNSVAAEAKAYYGWGQSLMETSGYGSTGSIDINGSSFDGIPNAFIDNLELYESSTNPEDVKNYLAGLARIDKDYYISMIGYSDEKLEDVIAVASLDKRGMADDNDIIGLWGSLSNQVTDSMLGDIPESGIISVGVASNLPSLESETYFDGADISNISKAIYLKNTESPYYYFYSVLRARYDDGSETNSFKKQLLQNDMFKVSLPEKESLNSDKQVAGAYRDFLDLEGLFTYIIPYLKEGNEYVEAWQDKHGSVVEGFDFEYTVDETGEATDIVSDGSVANQTYEDAAKLKNNMNRVWNMYSPWVDSLYDLGVLNTRVDFAGKSVIIGDSLNPSSYLEQGRPMIFSEADMIVKGYTYKDLTDIERRVQAVLEKTYEDMLYLVNYYDMDNEVLISAAAMYATFHFNEEFSKTSFFGDSVMLYPQGFELKNFNYDAFMRLALLNSTGEDIFATEDLYSRVLAKTSVFTGILLILCDIVACIAIPMFKFVILVGLLFLGILVCIACVINPPDKIFEAISKSLLLPTVLFMGLNIGFSWVMSLIIGEGLTAYVGSKSVNFATNDPTVTMLIMALLGVAYLFCAWKIIKFLIEAYKKFGVSTAIAAVGIVGSALSEGTAGVAKKLGKATGVGVGAAVGAATAEKGNRLAGAFEGSHLGAGGVIDRRIRDKRILGRMSEGLDESKSVTNSINEKAGGSSSDSTGGSTSGSTGGSASGSSSNSSGSGGSKSQSKDTSAPPSELDRKYTNDLDKNSTKLGKALSSVEFAKSKAKDALDHVKYKKDMTRESLRSRRMDIQDKASEFGSKAKSTAKSAAQGVKEAPVKTKSYLQKSLKQAKEHGEYHDLKRETRNAERMGRIREAAVQNNRREREGKVAKEARKARVDKAY